MQVELFFELEAEDDKISSTDKFFFCDEDLLGNSESNVSEVFDTCAVVAANALLFVDVAAAVSLLFAFVLFVVVVGEADVGEAPAEESSSYI